MPGKYEPTYIIYPSKSSTPNPTSSAQSYLKPTPKPQKFHPAAVYDAPSKSIYREETSKYNTHPGAIIHQKVIQIKNDANNGR